VAKVILQSIVQLFDYSIVHFRFPANYVFKDFFVNLAQNSVEC